MREGRGRERETTANDTTANDTTENDTTAKTRRDDRFEPSARARVSAAPRPFARGNVFGCVPRRARHVAQISRERGFVTLPLIRHVLGTRRIIADP